MTPSLALGLLFVALVTAAVEVDTEWSVNSTFPPLASNLVGLKGFNFTNLTGNVVNFNPSSERWQLQLNYSLEPLDALGRRDPSTVYSYALTFPEDELPEQNDTTWTLCAHSLQFPFPENITNRATPPDAESGDCTPYLGSACTADYMQALMSARRYTICPAPPLWSQIPSCAAQIGHQDVVSIISKTIMDWVPADVIYYDNNNTAVNRTTGQPLNGSPVHGLRSKQIFWKQGPAPDATDNTTLQREQASTLQFMAFTLSPSQQWASVQVNNVDPDGFSDVRLVCGRANSTFNGTITDPETSGQKSIRAGESATLAWSSFILATLLCAAAF